MDKQTPRELKHNIESIKKNEGLEENKQKVLDFDRELEANGRSVSTRRFYLLCLKLFLIHIGQKPLKKATKNDIMEFLERLKSRDFKEQREDKQKTAELSDSSMNIHKIVIKKFFQWLYGFEDREHPDLVKWVKIVKNGNNKTDFRDNMPTKEEIFGMINACTSARDRALVSVLWESGARIGELLSMKIGGVDFDEHGCVVKLPKSKTKPRRVRLISSVTYLSQWIESHPYKNDPEKPLWVNTFNKGKEGQAIGKGTVTLLLTTVARRTGLKKHIYPHIFRHSRATDIAKILSEGEMRVMFGWSKASNMASVYTHLNDQDVGDKLLEKSGVKKPEINLEECILNPKELRPSVCPRCDKKNTPDCTYCGCGQLLNQRHAFDMKDVEKVQGIQDSVMNQLAKDPEWLELTAKKIAEKGLSKVLEPLMTKH